MSDEKISQSEIARRLGLSPSRVSNLVKAGRFQNTLTYQSNGKKQFAWPDAKTEYESGVGNVTWSSAGTGDTEASDPTNYTAEQLEQMTQDLGGDDLREMAAKLPARETISRLNEFIKFKKTQMEYDKERGKYVDIDEAREVITSEYARISTRLMNSARSIAEKAIAIDDVEQLREMLEDDFRTLLQELSDPNDICRDAKTR